jgi:ribosomal-protein-alanine N-acetyltransferase
MRLETQRLILRPLNMNDLHDFHRILSQKEVMQYLPDSTPTLDELREYFLWFFDCYEKNTPDKIIKYTIGVELKDGGCLIGWCGFGPLDFNPDEIELYCGIAQEHWNKGYATEASRAVLDFAFTKVGLDEIVAVVMPVNKASIRMIEKVGLIYRKKVENLPEKFTAYEGDHYYSLTKAEYESMLKKKA